MLSRDSPLVWAPPLPGINDPLGDTEGKAGGAEVTTTH